MAVPDRRTEVLAERIRRDREREHVPPEGLAAADIKRDPDAPTVGVHWGVLAVALVAAIWFVLAMVFLFASGEAVSDYLLFIVGGFAVVFFALTLGLGRWAADDPRWCRRKGRRFADFVEGNVAISTGAIAGKEAMTQLLTLPVALAIGATVIGIIFLAVN
jgi:hypothetical protein